MALNALLKLGLDAQAKFDLVGPTVDDDVRRIISRYGREAVVDAIKRATKAKRGRKAEADWPEIDKILKMDARSLLEGGNPFAERTNYSIAKAYSEKNPGHSHAATHRRILKKLAEKRVLFTLINAYMIGKEEYSYLAYLSVLKRLAEEMPDGHWEKRLKHSEEQVGDYIVKHGHPADSLTMKDIEEGAQSPVVSALLAGNPAPLGGLFGLASKLASEG